jgi:hypothetical protein
VDIDLLEESLLESTREQLIAVGRDCVWEAKLSVPGTIKQLSDVLGGSGSFQRLDFAIVRESVCHDEH